MNPFENWVASDFREHAVNFCDLARVAYGLELDFSAGTLAQLDDLIDLNFAPGSADDHSDLIVGMGCYLGEVVIHNHGGGWHADEEFFHSPAVVIEGKLQTRTFPLSRVWRRFEYGPEHSLVAYYSEVCRTLARL
ncbi:MAG: hypothetical protein HY656_07515 [Acidobacteria bacterium]|nr:hypothetical protein [Acidobacteriota bacterium]